MKAILFEYEQDLEFLLTYLLEKEGFVVEVAPTRELLMTLSGQISPDLILLGNCPPYVPQTLVVNDLRPFMMTSSAYLLILSTSHAFYEEIQSENTPGIFCIKTPVEPSVIKQELKRLSQTLRSGVSPGLNQTNSTSG